VETRLRLTCFGEAIVVAMGNFVVNPNGNISNALLADADFRVGVLADGEFKCFLLFICETGSCNAFLLRSSFEIADPADDDLFVVICKRTDS